MTNQTPRRMTGIERAVLKCAARRAGYHVGGGAIIEAIASDLRTPVSTKRLYSREAVRLAVSTLTRDGYLESRAGLVYLTEKAGKRLKL